MILPKTIRKFLAVLRGGVSPVIIFLSIMLGFWFGLVPGWSGLSKDIGEQNELSKQKPEVLATVKARFEAWKKLMAQAQPRRPFRNF